LKPGTVRQNSPTAIYLNSKVLTKRSKEKYKNGTYVQVTHPSNYGRDLIQIRRSSLYLSLILYWRREIS
jgi:hypothetical protein